MDIGEAARARATLVGRVGAEILQLSVQHAAD